MKRTERNRRIHEQDRKEIANQRINKVRKNSDKNREGTFVTYEQIGFKNNSRKAIKWVLAFMVIALLLALIIGISHMIKSDKAESEQYTRKSQGTQEVENDKSTVSNNDSSIALEKYKESNEQADEEKQQRINELETEVDKLKEQNNTSNGNNVDNNQNESEPNESVSDASQTQTQEKVKESLNKGKEKVRNFNQKVADYIQGE